MKCFASEADVLKVMSKINFAATKPVDAEFIHDFLPQLSFRPEKEQTKKIEHLCFSPASGFSNTTPIK